MKKNDTKELQNSKIWEKNIKPRAEGIKHKKHEAELKLKNLRAVELINSRDRKEKKDKS